MEDQIIEWKSMWQEQKSNSLNANELIERLNQMERKTKIERVKLIGAATVLVVTCFLGMSELLVNKFYLISIILLLTGILIKLVPLYKTKLGMISDDSSFNNHKFIQILKAKLAFKSKHLLIYMSIIILGLNVALLGLYQNGTIFNVEINNENRIFFHLATILLFIVAYVSNKNNLENNKKETLRLISDIEENT